jgi:uncharacterized membrane protein YagU involved in acid resistance
MELGLLSTPFHFIMAWIVSNNELISGLLSFLFDVGNEVFLPPNFGVSFHSKF